MRQIRQIIWLFTEETSKHQISKRLGVSRNTLKKIGLLEEHRLTYEELSELEDKDLDELFENSSDDAQSSQVQELDYSYISKELKRIGVTRYLLWEEYRKYNLYQ